jgi:hypothetical protein
MAGIGEMLTLASTGVAINNRSPKKDIRNQNNKSKKEKLNTRNIYATNNSRAVRDDFENKARTQYRQSNDFKNTKVIPHYYKALDDFNRSNKNKVALIEAFDGLDGMDDFASTRKKRQRTDSDSMFSDDNKTFESFDDNNSFCSTGSNRSNQSDAGYHGFSDPGSMLDKINNMSNNRKFESCVARHNSAHNRDKFTEKDTWMNQHSLMRFDNAEGFVASNNSNKNELGKNARMERIEMERQMEIDGGYSLFDQQDDGTYGVVSANSPEFVHQNMLPFVRKGPNAVNESKRNMVNDMKLDLYTGSTDNPDWRPKIERAPLFSPLIGAKNIYGDPVRTDEYKSRYFPGNERRNELPFQQVKVTPGLNIGYDAIGKHGYHDMYRVVPTEAYVDNLRTLNNPKISYGSYVGPGQKGEKGPVLGKVTQYKTPRYRERGTKDMVRGRSYITAPTVYGEYDPKSLATVNRGVDETLAIGPAKHHLEGNTPSKYRGNYRSSRKENYMNDHPRNVILYESLAGQGHNNDSFLPDPTKRELKSQHGHAHNPENAKGVAVNYNDATPDPTKRDVNNKFDRSGHVTGDRAQIVAIDWNKTPDPTKRDEHNRFDRSGHVTGERAQIVAVDWNNLPDPTKRDEHNRFDRSGHVTGERAQIVAVDWNKTPDPTKRDEHNRFDRSGHLTGERAQITAIDWNQTPDPTKRNIHDQYDRSGHLTGERAQIVAVDWNQTPDPTKRNIHDQYDRSGHLTGERAQIVAVDWNQTPDPTKRNIHDQYDRSGHLTGERAQITAIDWNQTPDPTKRNIHDQYDRSGHLTGEKAQIVAVDWNQTPDPTKRNIHDRFDRSGHLTGERAQIVAVDWNQTPDPTKRNQHDRFDRSGHLTGNREQYVAIDWDQVPDPTKRNQHEHFDRSGHLTGNREQYVAIDWDQVPDPTKRNQHEHFDRSGHLTGNREQYTAINWDQVPDPTKRNQHDRFDRSGHLTGNRGQYTAIDWNQTPDPTKRDEHNRYDRSGHLTGNREQYVAIDWDQVPDPTKRNQHNRYDRSGHLTGNREQHIAINWDDVPDATKREQNPGGRHGAAVDINQGIKTIDWDDVPDATKREQNPGGRHGTAVDINQGIKTINWDDVPDATKREQHPGGRMGGAESYDKRQGSRHQYMVMNIDGAKEALEEGRAPTGVGQDKSWTIDYTAFRFRDPVETKWRPSPYSDITVMNDRYKSVNTNIPVNKVVINDRITAFTNDNLRGNPYVSNLLHKSV